MEKIWFAILVPVLQLVYCFMGCFAMTPTTNLTTDQVALLALKSHITPADSSSVLAYNWSTATSYCNWIGVTCGRRHQRVTGLNLASMGLAGTIPPHIGNLSFLASLNLRNNSFHGHLPDQLSFLHRLKVIILRLNNFNGQIPSWFGHFPNLQTLRLSNNSFSGPIPSTMYNMSLLQFLDLSHNSLSNSLPSTLHECRRLEILSLSSNNLTGSIPKEIGNLTMLKELYLGSNILKGEIPKEVGYLQHLEVFSLLKNKLKGSIPTALFNISSLIGINVGINSLSSSLPFDMCDRLPALIGLYIALNKIRGSIPQGIGNCTSLTGVNLGSNILTGVGKTLLSIIHQIQGVPMVERPEGYGLKVSPMCGGILTLMVFLRRRCYLNTDFALRFRRLRLSTATVSSMVVDRVEISVKSLSVAIGVSILFGLPAMLEVCSISSLSGLAAQSLVVCLFHGSLVILSFSLSFSVYLILSDLPCSVV